MARQGQASLGDGECNRIIMHAPDESKLELVA